MNSGDRGKVRKTGDRWIVAVDEDDLCFVFKKFKILL